MQAVLSPLKHRGLLSMADDGDSGAADSEVDVTSGEHTGGYKSTRSGINFILQITTSDSRTRRSSIILESQ